MVALEITEQGCCVAFLIAWVVLNKWRKHLPEVTLAGRFHQAFT